jgi:hypothetical protein
MTKQNTEAADEFEDSDLTSEVEVAEVDDFSGYEAAGKFGDADDAPKRRIIEDGTKVTLGIAGFQLYDRKKGSECIAVSLEVIAPTEYVGDETNFKPRLWLKTARNEGSSMSAWEVTGRQITRLFAAVYQKPLKDTSVTDCLDPAFLAVEGVTDRGAKKVAFHKALVALLNEELAGKSFETDIGVDPASTKNGRTYKRRQNLGRPYYPGRREKDAE